MKRVTGIGGVFFKAKDPKALSEWYRAHLGINVAEWGGAVFRWAEDSPAGSTAWNLFKDDTSYFAPSTSSFMVNYRVDDLDALLAKLREEGCDVDEKVLADCLNEISRELLQADVRFETVRDVKAGIKSTVNLDALAAGTDKRRVIQKAVVGELCRMLDPGKPAFTPGKGKPSVVMSKPPLLSPRSPSV